MTQLTLRYDTETQRVEQKYWGADDPDWADDQRDGTVVTTTETSPSRRQNVVESALDSLEAGADYDPETETPVAKLCYNRETDELRGEVEIQPLNG